jgi:hypothetical protein
MKKQTIHLLTVILGTILALAIVFSQVFLSQPTTAKNTVKTEQQKKDSTPSEDFHISAPSITLPSSVHVHLNLDIYCLFEILLGEKPEEFYLEDLPLYTQRFFQTLFRVIISPNAP